jgi:hypothetical protein
MITDALSPRSMLAPLSQPFRDEWWSDAIDWPQFEHLPLCGSGEQVDRSALVSTGGSKDSNRQKDETA